jgi:dTDP-4-dehydrorhamnose reductase
LRILLTGRTGQVGSALETSLAPLGELTALDRAGLDLRAGASVVAGIRPDVIVNAAAYTAVDRAEQEPDVAHAVNAEGAGRLASEANRIGALLVHFSTDYVFDGCKSGPYVETDPTNPLNAYGRSKLAGERAIAASGCRYFVFRTSWVYAPRGRNFVNTILAAARDKPELRIVDDQQGAPTSSLAIAAGVTRVLGDPALRAKPSGIYHMTAAGQTTWHAFAKAVLAARGITTPVVPIRSDELHGAAPRPRNSLLDNSKLASTFGVALADWRSGLAEVLPAFD